MLRDIETKSSGTKFDSQVGGEKRALTVIFDDDAKTMTMKEGGAETPLKDVAISQTSMTAASNNISLGIDRSSWYIVLQTYTFETIRSEFGSCSLRS